MPTAIASLMIAFLALAGVALVTQGSLKSLDMLSDAWKQMEVRSGEIARTEIEVIGTSLGGANVDITIRNSGQTALRDFASWDVVVQYYDQSNAYYQLWVPYTTSSPPGNNQWTVTGIYIDAQTGKAEVFQPNILDPEEELKIRIKLSPAPRSSANHQAIIGAPNGVSVSTIF